MLDLVASDLVAALILVRYLQRNKDDQMRARLVGNRSAEEAIKDSLHAVSSRSVDADLYQSEVKGNQPVVEAFDGSAVAHLLASPEYVALSSQNHFYRALDHTLLMRSSRSDTALMKGELARSCRRCTIRELHSNSFGYSRGYICFSDCVAQ